MEKEMITLALKNECSGCGACVAACPQRCIDMVEDDEGFLYPQIDHSRCVRCRKCQVVCQALKKPLFREAIGAYAARACEDGIRKKSSSGGMFTLLAKWVLSSGGVIFGAVLNENLELVHSFADCEAALPALCGSKYLQSRIGDAFAQADQFLRDGRNVLFTGTPCQIAGLKNFLGREEDRLICADIVCHGVPSQRAWRSYIGELEENAGAKLEAFNFRDKSDGWRGYCVTARFADGTSYSKKVNQDPFMWGYLSNLYMRPSCHLCYKNSAADLTLGDCWGAETLAPRLDDDTGTSLVIIRSEKGREAFDTVAQGLEREAISYSDALRHNSSVCSPAEESKKRQKFFKSQQPFVQTVEQLTKVTFMQRWKLRFRALRQKMEARRRK